MNSKGGEGVYRNQAVSLLAVILNKLFLTWIFRTHRSESGAHISIDTFFYVYVLPWQMADLINLFREFSKC